MYGFHGINRFFWNTNPKFATLFSGGVDMADLLGNR